MSVHAFPIRDGEEREPEWPKLRVRCLKPFYWHDEVRRGAHVVHLSENRVVQTGEELEIPEPDARSLIGAGRAELVE